MTRQWAAGLLLSALCAPASAGYSGKDLLGFCEGQEAFGKGVCVGLISGSINSYLQGSRITAQSLISSIARNSGKGPVESDDIANAALLNPGMFYLFNGYCPQDGLTQGQITDVVLKYLHRNPDQRDRPAELLVISAMSDAFPVQGCNWKPPAAQAPK